MMAGAGVGFSELVDLLVADALEGGRRDGRR